MKRKAAIPLSKRLRLKRPSDDDLEAMAEITTSDIIAADSDWNEGAKALKELLEARVDSDEAEEVSS